MSAISQIASKFLGGSKRGGAASTRGAAKPRTGGSPGGTTGGKSSDAAVGRAAKGVFSKLRR